MCGNDIGDKINESIITFLKLLIVKLFFSINTEKENIF